MKWRLISLVLVSVLWSCNSAKPQQEGQTGEHKPPSTMTSSVPIEPVLRVEGRRLTLPQGLVGQIPDGADASGWTILLQGADEEVANISFAECPKGAPDSGCIGNHRAITVKETVSVAGQSASRFEAEYSKNSAAADKRTWLEVHVIVPLPSGRRIDIIGQALSGSGKEAELRSIHQTLVSSFRRP